MRSLAPSFPVGRRGSVIVVVLALITLAAFFISQFIERAMTEKTAGAAQFRVEINMQYTTRYQELLMAYVADHGDVPVGNKGGALPRLGRLSPL